MTPKDIPVKAEKEDLVSASCRRDERERPAAALAMTAQLPERANAPRISGTRRWCASRFLRLGIGLFGLFGVWPFATAAFALDPQKAVSQFVHAAWTEKEGAPANIAAITQTQDGNNVLTLFEDREGNIWLGSAPGLDRNLDLPTGRPKRLCGG
jgi:Two component regulator propeller